ncbi:MAG: DoxX-like family protein [Planctomycetota bacterium]
MIQITIPAWLPGTIRVAVAAVWLYEGLWCKLLGRDPNQLTIVKAVPQLGPRWGAVFLYSLGLVEVALGGWALWGVQPFYGAVVQTVLLVTLNANGLIWSRKFIHDPPGMVVKNFAFLVLVWVSACLPGLFLS